jgi:hypothetical protein
MKESNKCVKKYLNVPPDWIFGTIKTEMKLLEHDGTLDDLHDEHDKALAYWRQNHRQYPPGRVWDKYYFNLISKSFKSRHEIRAWCEARDKQLRDPVYLEEQRQLYRKAEEEKRLTREAEEQRRRETPRAWEHYFAKQEEANKHAREADA